MRLWWGKNDREKGGGVVGEYGTSKSAATN